MGDADAVKSTALGMKNLQRVSKMLMSATAYKEGDTYNELSELYGRMLSQWQLEMGHVAQVVGGFNSQEKVVGQEGRIFTLVPKVRQQEAVKFLVDNAFTTPMWMIDPEILRRIEAVGALDRIRNAQQSVLNNLLNSMRFARLIEQETLDGSAAYSPVDFLTTVRKGIWRELDAPVVKIDAYRRALQRSYLTTVNSKLNPTATVTAAPFFPPPDGGPPALRVANSGDEKPMYRAELRALSAAITAAIAKTTDHETKAHLEASKDEIRGFSIPTSFRPLPPPPQPGAAGAECSKILRRGAVSSGPRRLGPYRDSTPLFWSSFATIRSRRAIMPSISSGVMNAPISRSTSARGGEPLATDRVRHCNA